MEQSSFKSGKHLSQGSFKSFIPEEINKTFAISDMEVFSLLSKADRHIGRLDMYSEYIPNIDLFIRMHVLKEATQSSKIEGTQTNMEEALQEKEDVSAEKREDWEEVQNYIEAMNEAISALKDLPLSSRLIKNTHRTLLQGVRGKHKLPGEFRSSQNWIGGASLADAVFIPPPHHDVNRLMGDLEKFIHGEEFPLPDLLKIAMIHYQFETIHPFLDGNGRVGRLLITLYLVEKNILKKPILYLSDFFEKNRQLYYDNLMRVRTHHDIGQWFKFFLVGIIETAKNGVETFDAIMKLQKSTDEKLQTLGSRTNVARTLISSLYKNPYTTAAAAASITQISPPSAYSLLAELENLNIIKEITGGKRGKKYLFMDYLDLFRS
ncbi:MAG TPA: Fic family protein [Cryomorphaceae bacterium]|nr:Fic family protein [Cryomorphaceae bacterium]